MALQLYVWLDFATDYTKGLAFAIASSEEEARQIVVGALGSNPSEWGGVTVLPIDKPVGFAVYGGA